MGRGDDDAALRLDACAAVFERLSCGKSDVPAGVEQGISRVLDCIGADIELTVRSDDAGRVCIEFAAQGVDDVLLCVVGSFCLPDPLLIGTEVCRQVGTLAEQAGGRSGGR